jgi:hypothetical protein
MIYVLLGKLDNLKTLKTQVSNNVNIDKVNEWIVSNDRSVVFNMLSEMEFDEMC